MNGEVLESFDSIISDLPELRVLSEVVESVDDLEQAFERVFTCGEASSAKGIVYFFHSADPIPRLRGESRVLYIGKTNQSLNSRYRRYAKKLASGASGAFYRYVVDRFGPLSFAYINSSDPKVDEAIYFRQYRQIHMEYPPKSKVG